MIAVAPPNMLVAVVVIATAVTFIFIVVATLAFNPWTSLPFKEMPKGKPRYCKIFIYYSLSVALSIDRPWYLLFFV